VNFPSFPPGLALATFGNNFQMETYQWQFSQLPPKNFGTRMTNGTAWKTQEGMRPFPGNGCKTKGVGSGRVRVHILQYLLLRRKLFAKLNFN